MKKLLLMLLIPFMIGCSENESVTISKNEYSQLKGVITTIEIDELNWDISVGEDGHTYCNNNLASAYCLFHYPDCKKCRVRDSLMMVSIIKNK